MAVLFTLTPISQAADGTPGIVHESEDVLPTANVVMRVTPVQGNGANGGATNQFAFPDLSLLTTTDVGLNRKFLDTAYGEFHKIADMDGSTPEAELACSLRYVNSATVIHPGVQTYRDIVFDILDSNNTDKMDFLQHYELEITPLLPETWITVANMPVEVEGGGSV